jgi:hypothetical protein
VYNYFNYFTEIEEHFQRRRGTGLLLSTLDWALIETWKDACIPLEAVLRGIDAAFERWERRPSRTRKVNSLAYCSQEVLAAMEKMKEAGVGAARETAPNAAAGLERERIAAYLQANAERLSQVDVPVKLEDAIQETARSLREAAGQEGNANLEELERRLTVLEEKLFAAMLTATPEEEVLKVRSEADRELVPYRAKMSAAQIEQLHKQFLQKRLLEIYGLPRLSLFYM